MLTLKIEGMSCNHCKNLITQAIQNIDSKADVLVDIEKGLVNVKTFAPKHAICDAIVDKGYKIESETTSAKM